MANIFSASEVVEIGIQIEKNGRDFYKAIVRLSKNPKAKELFEFLAGEEERHIERFQHILSQVKKYEPPEAYTDEYFAYLKALSEGHVFTKKDKGSEAARNIKNEIDAIDLAIGFEKDSILFYTETKKIVLADEEKILDKLIEEEEDHFRRLTELKENL